MEKEKVIEILKGVEFTMGTANILKEPLKLAIESLEKQDKTEVSCGFVKCKYNSYGKECVCQLKSIQMGGLYAKDPMEKSRRFHPVCVNYTPEKEKGE